MQKSIVAFDIDGVLAQFGRSFMKAVVRLFPEKGLTEDYIPSSWFYSEVLSKDEMDAAWKATINTPNLWYDLQAYAENVAALTKFLHRFNKEFDVYYITSRLDVPKSDSAFGQTAKWLIEFNLLLYNTSLLVVKESKDKLPVIKALHIESIVDDYLPTVASLMDVPGHTPYLYDRPWNRENRPEGIRVVKDLQGYLDALLINRK